MEDFHGSIVLIDRPPKRDENRILYKNFPVSAEFRRDWWNGRVVASPRDSAWYSAMHDGIEVARVQVQLDRSLDAGYWTAPQPSAGFVEIVFLEVSKSLLGATRGVGSVVVSEVLALYPGQQIATFPKASADGFWKRLRWTRHEHSEGVGRFPALYVCPDRISLGL
jgi:hypothetical protein